MSHSTDDDLVLHYYGDPECPPATGPHLDACGACRRRYSDLSATLALMPEEIPHRGDGYGQEVWQRLGPVLGADATAHARWWTFAIAASVLLMAGAAFIVDRSMSTAPQAEIVDAARASERPDEESRRMLHMAVADHLERSDRVLTEVMNAGSDDLLETQKGWAEDLLWAGRLYRQSALDSNERSVAAVLDDVERTLLDIVHTTERPSAAELNDVRRRVDSAALLFKVRVLRDELHQPPAAAGGGRSPLTLSEAS